MIGNLLHTNAGLRIVGDSWCRLTADHSNLNRKIYMPLKNKKSSDDHRVSSSKMFIWEGAKLSWQQCVGSFR
jgi:hypothetical protein